MIVDDHEIVRRGIAEIVDPFVLELVARSVRSQRVRRADLVRALDVILVGPAAPDGTGIDIMNSLRLPPVDSVVLTSFRRRRGLGWSP